MSLPSTFVPALHLNSDTPAPPTDGSSNIIFQTDGGTPLANVTAFDPLMVGDSGSGGYSGNVPPPGSGDAAAGKFLKADGTWAVPAGGGGGGTGGGGGALVPLGVYDVTSGSAALTMTTRNASGQSGALFQSDFKRYVIYYENLTAASAADFWLRGSSNGGSSWDSAGNYVGQALRFINSAQAQGGSSSSGSALTGWNITGNENQDYLTAGQASGFFTIQSPLSTTAGEPTINGQASFRVVTSSYYETAIFGGQYLNTTGMNAIEVYSVNGGSSVNLASGHFVVYGISETGSSSGFTSGNNANGYWVKDPTGHIRQWGNYNTDLAGGTVTVTFPTPFTTLASITVVVATRATYYRTTYLVDGSVTTTTFQMANTGGPAYATWSADGY